MAPSMDDPKEVEDNNDDNKFISWTEFHDCLVKKQILYKKFLPNNYMLSQVLVNIYNTYYFFFL
jgi:hypothetical protein